MKMKYYERGEGQSTSVFRRRWIEVQELQLTSHLHADLHHHEIQFQVVDAVIKMSVAQVELSLTITVIDRAHISGTQPQWPGQPDQEISVSS